MSINIRLMSLEEESSYVPLAVLGYCLTRTKFLKPVFAGIDLPIKKEVDHSVADKLQDVLVSILAGCRSISQVNTRIRPDLALARTWQRKRFAEQSNLARTLDAFSEIQLQQLRTGSETLFRRESRTLRHSFQTDWLWLDIDFTPLPISKHAQGSTKGKIEGKKTNMVVSWLGFMRLNITKPCSPIFMLAANPTTRLIFQPCKQSMLSWISRKRPSKERSSVPMPGLAVTTTSIMR